MCVHAFTSAAADKPRFDKVHFLLGGGSNCTPFATAERKCKICLQSHNKNMLMCQGAFFGT